MSFTTVVPAVVPSDFQSSRPVVPSSARKNSVPFTLVRAIGRLLPTPLHMSFTSVVPAVVPSDFQSSRPLVPSLALKNRVPLTLLRRAGIASGRSTLYVLHQHSPRRGPV